MKESRWPQALIMGSGLLLILLGIAAIALQLWTEILAGPNTGQPISQKIVVSPNELGASTRFVGLELILVGALLEIVGYISTWPWRSEEKASS
ncbi:MAG: hypothetical protein QOF41_650 [Methylobacteriaceae bacterium]|nr:hypothetical protein [Methylobacteriaceae bacterium]